MPTYRTYLTTAQDLQIEVEGVETSSTSYSDALSASITEMATQFGTAISEIPEEQRPTQLMQSFGLRALASGGFAIAQSEDVVNFRITMIWGSGGGSGSELLSGIVPTPQ